MTENKIIEEVVQPGLSAYAKARYVKIYAAPNRDAQVFDVMHRKGFRINFDIQIGEPKETIIEETIKLAQEYRPASWMEISPDIIFIANFAADTLSVDGKLVKYDIGSKKFVTRWCQLMLIDYLKKIRVDLQYEDAIELLANHYAASGI